MKNKFINLLVITSSLIILIELILNKNLIFTTITYSLKLWTTSIIPSLFPFFIISDILITYNITYYIPKPIKKIFKNIFNVSEYCLSIFFLSMLSGFPSNARNTKKYYEQGLITKEEADHILTFTHFSNPLFILSTIAVLFLDNEKLGLPILISHYLGNIIIGILTRNNHKNKTQNTKEIKLDKQKSQNFGKVLTKSITSSIDTLLLILGTLTCFLVLSALIINTLNLNLYNTTLIKCILEITMGLKSLSLLNLNNTYKIIISSIALSFGGLSVHMQVISQISDTNISYTKFFISRIYHAIISGLIAFLISFIIT